MLLEIILPKPKSAFRNLNKGVKEFLREFVLAFVDKQAVNNTIIAV